MDGPRERERENATFGFRKVKSESTLPIFVPSLLFLSPCSPPPPPPPLLFLSPRLFFSSIEATGCLSLKIMQSILSIVLWRSPRDLRLAARLRSLYDVEIFPVGIPRAACPSIIPPTGHRRSTFCVYVLLVLVSRHDCVGER